MTATTVHIDRTLCTRARYGHGTDSAYSHGCRCPDARAAWTTYCRAVRTGTHRPRIIPIAPTATRLQILAASGYDWRTLTRELGWRHSKQVRDLAYAHYPKVLRTTHLHVAATYGRLIERPQPHGYGAARAINNALRAGWGVIDPLKVDRALGGHDLDLTPLERQAVIYTGLARGHATSAIAEAAHVNSRTVRAALAA